MKHQYEKLQLLNTIERSISFFHYCFELYWTQMQMLIYCLSVSETDVFIAPTSRNLELILSYICLTFFNRIVSLSFKCLNTTKQKFRKLLRFVAKQLQFVVDLNAKHLLVQGSQTFMLCSQHWFAFNCFGASLHFIDACGTKNPSIKRNLFTFQTIFSFYPGGPKNKKIRLP